MHANHETRSSRRIGLTSSLTGLVALGLMAGVAQADPQLWTVDDGGNGHRYEVVVPEGGITWSDARAAAEAAGGYLATLTSQAEFEFVESLDHPTKGWVGGYRTGSDWYWVTGESFETTQWCGGQPGNGGDFLQLAYGCFIADGDTPDEGEFYVIEYEDAAVEWSVADGGNGHRYEVVVPEGGITWTDARAAAEAAGGYLATLTSQAEFEFVESLDHPTKGWVGGYRTGSDWYWVTGESFEATQWCGGQPGTGGDFLQLAYGCFIADGDTPDEGEFYVIEYEDAAVEWSVADGGNGHWYAFMPAFMPWSEAKAEAESLGGYLCCMETTEEWVWIRDELVEPRSDALFSESGWGVCIGGYQDLDSPDYSEPYGGWTWLTGEPFACGGEFNCNMENYWGVQHNMSLVRNAGYPVQFNDIDEVPDQPYYMIEWSADCNGDGIVDYGQILDGSLVDEDGDGVPDVCDCRADLNADGSVTVNDLLIVIAQWATEGPLGDLDADGTVNVQDLLLVIQAWGTCG